ncbi:MAG: S41 family peptidase [Pseudoalteromonas sp.]|uniref:S41 family peptidase n=1 Tax=unclassified Pseudoalteromonas TaxID=194690 RepID=UPI003F9DA58B
MLNFNTHSYPRTVISNNSLCLLLLILSFVTHSATSIKDLKSPQRNEIIFNIHTYYVEDLALQQSFEDINQFEMLLASLDPYSKYLDEKELDAIFNNNNGRYTGLGIEVKEQSNQIYIVGTIKDSPAAKAGIKANDMLIAINRKNINKHSIERVAELIRESQNPTITLTVKRGNEQHIELAVTRQEINIESVTSSLAEFGIGYIAIKSFNNHTLHNVARQVTILQSNNGDELSGLVLDLRDNPGGTLQSAVAVSDLFLQSGTIVTTRGRFYDANQEYKAQHGDILSNVPIAVLINEKSASAAEILAAALRDNDRATLVGNQSFGKGSVQSLIPLGNGNTALKLTTAKYFTPLGKSIDGVGIMPDVTINQTTLPQTAKAVIIKYEQGMVSQQSLQESLPDRQLLKATQLLTIK